jgi:hypothetical protein
LLQLTPEGIELIDVAVADCSGIAYGCVVAGVPKPHEAWKFSGLGDPAYFVLRTLCRLLHALTSQQHPRWPHPRPTKTGQRQLDRSLGLKASSATSDGVVPTLSLLHGRVLHVTRADRLDAVAHYTPAGGNAGDWLPLGAGFTREAFGATWKAVASAIARSR